MARPLQLISLAPSLAESLIAGGQDRPEHRHLELDRKGAPASLPFSPKALGALLKQQGRSRLPLAIVLPSKAITFRKVQFPFANPKKVLQALEFELEHELLGDIDQHVFTYRMQGQPDGSAVVSAYLMERSVLNDLLDICREHRVSPYRITFSASALYLSTPLHSPLHFQLYAGAEETFISVIRSNRLHSVRTFPFNPIGPILASTEQPIRSAREFMELLDRRRGGEGGENGAGNGAGGAEAPAENGPAQRPFSGEVDRRRHGAGSERQLFLQRFRTEFEALLPDLNQFVRLHAFGEPITMSVHGMFAPFLHWDSEGREFTLQEAPPAADGGSRDSLGIVEELQTHPEEFRAGGLISFQRQHAGWVQQLLELRRPLTAMAAGLAVLLALVAGNFYLNFSAMQQELRRLDAETRSQLSQNLPNGTAASEGMRLLQEQVEQLRTSLEADARFVNYRYNVLEALKTVTGLFEDHPGLTVESLTLSDERFSIAGKTPSYNDSESLRNRLAALERFKEREAKITHQRTAQDISFRISIEP